MLVSMFLMDLYLVLNYGQPSQSTFQARTKFCDESSMLNIPYLIRKMIFWPTSHYLGRSLRSTTRLVITRCILGDLAMSYSAATKMLRQLQWKENTLQYWVQ